MGGKPREKETSGERHPQMIQGSIPGKGRGISHCGLQQLCCGQRAWESSQLGSTTYLHDHSPDKGSDLQQGHH